MSVPADPPAQLARFPLEVHDAYQRFCATGDESAIHTMVRAALLDFLPRHDGALRARALSDESRLLDDLGYDSLAIAELVFFFEDLFKVTITTDEIRPVRTVGDLRAFVARKLAANRSLA